MHLTTNTSVSPNRFVPPLFQDASTISFDTAAQWPQQEMRHLRKLVAAAELLGVPRPALAENAESLTPELRQEFEHWITRLPLNRLCRERPEACEAFMEAVQSADEAYRRQADKSTTTRRFLQYALSVLDRNLNPSPEDIAVRERAHGLETHYLNQLAPRERHSFILAQRCADRSMDKAVTQGYGSKDFHAQHPEFWRYLTIIRHVRNMALDVIADKSTIDTPKVLPMGGNIVPIVTRHPTYRRTADQNDCARELRLHLEGNIQDKAVDQARAVDLMNGMVGKELIKPTIMDEMKMTAADTQNDFRSHLYGSEAARNTDHLKKISRLSPDMFVWPAFDQDVDEPEKLTGCMEALSCMMRKSKWDVIVESLKRHKVSPELLTRAEATRDYWTLGVQWWEKNLQFEAERRNQVIRSDKPIDASLVDVTQHPDYPRMTAGKIGRNEQANEERDALLALLAAEKNPRLEPLAKLVEIKGLGANGEFRISGAGPRGFLAPGPDGKLQIKPTMKRLLEERRWEM
ncbi:MAG: hypothetical protein Q7U75_14330, partial [Desulfobacterales bacterium]|nr:hypothetical protein [Desulfobacterales bacterium]